MTDMIVNLHLRELPDGGFLATLADSPGFAVRGETAGATLEKARAEIEAHRAGNVDNTGHDADAQGRADNETGAPDARNAAPGEDGIAGLRAGDLDRIGDGGEPDAPSATGSSGSEKGASHASPAVPMPGASTGDEEELLRQVTLLNHVEREDALSQRRLAKLMNLNLATVNQIVKRLVKKGYVKTRRLNGRSVAYYLTPQGFSEKLRLVLAYTRQTISFFATVRELLNAELSRLQQEQGITSVAIIGTGELAEAAYLSAREQGLAITAIHDEEKAGQTWLGHAVTWPVAMSGEDGLSRTAIVRAEMHPETDADQTASEDQTAVEATQHPTIDLPHLLSERMGRFAVRMDAEADADVQVNPGAGRATSSHA